MTELYPYAPPDGVEVLIVWLSPLGETRDERPTGAVLPFRLVQRIDGDDDRLTDHGIYEVYTFGATNPSAQAAATITDQRVNLLAGRFTGQQKVVISTGTIVADDLKTLSRPKKVKWVDSSLSKTLYAYKAIYRLDLRFGAV